MENTETTMVNLASRPALKVLGRGKAKGHTAIAREWMRIIRRASREASWERWYMPKIWWLARAMDTQIRNTRA